MENANENQNISPMPVLMTPVKKWHQHRGIITVIVLTFLVAIVSCIYLIHQPAPDVGPIVVQHKVKSLQQTPTSTPIQTDTSNWQTYSNNDLGFSIQYPSGWFAKTSPVLEFSNVQEQSPLSDAVLKSTAQFTIQIATTTNNLSITELNQQIQNDLSSTPLSQTISSVAGYQAIKVQTAEIGEWTHYYVIVGSKIFNVGYLDAATQAEPSQFLPLYQAMVNSIKFLPLSQSGAVAPATTQSRPALTTQQIQDQFNSDNQFCNNGKKVNGDPASTTVPYSNQQFGFAFNVPYNNNWGTSQFKPVPYEESFATTTTDDGISQFGSIDYGRVSPFEGCGFVREMSLLVLEKQTPEQFINTLKKRGSDYDLIDPKPSQKTINALTVVEYGDAGLCSYSMAVVFGTKYDYMFSPTCGGDYSQIESTIATIKLLN